MVRRFSKWLAVKLIRDHHKTEDPDVRYRYGLLEGWTSIIGNTLLFAIKITAGLSINSISLIADAIHTLSDSITSVVVITGFRLARKPADRTHPFGHGKMESIATIVVATLLTVAGFELLHNSVSSIITPHTSHASIAIIILITGTLMVKELMARFSYELGTIIDSKALIADGHHHRSDVFSTALVVIALIASRYGYDSIDGIMGVGVSLVIFFSAWTIARDAVTPLLGEAPSREILELIERKAMNNPGVYGVHDIIYHKYGSTCIISLHIEVSEDQTAAELHSISEKVEKDIANEIQGTVVTHIDPINRNHPLYHEISETIEGIISSDDRLGSYHDLRIIGDSDQNCSVVFNIALNNDNDENLHRKMVAYVEAKFHKKFPHMETIIKAGPKYSYNL